MRRLPPSQIVSGGPIGRCLSPVSAIGVVKHICIDLFASGALLLGRPRGWKAAGCVVPLYCRTISSLLRSPEGQCVGDKHRGTVLDRNVEAREEVDSTLAEWPSGVDFPSRHLPGAMAEGLRANSNTPEAAQIVTRLCARVSDILGFVDLSGVVCSRLAIDLITTITCWC